MARPEKITKEEIIAHLKKEGVTDINSLADLLIRKTHQDGDPNKPIVNSAIIYQHGFVSH